MESSYDPYASEVGSDGMVGCEQCQARITTSTAREYQKEWGTLIRIIKVKKDNGREGARTLLRDRSK